MTTTLVTAPMGCPMGVALVSMVTTLEVVAMGCDPGVGMGKEVVVAEEALALGGGGPM